jgi:hypothetical protein
MPFQNDLTVIFTIVMMITGITIIFMIVPLLVAPYLTSRSLAKVFREGCVFVSRQPS